MSIFHRRKNKATNDTLVNGAKLITVAHPKGPISEQFRTIRTSINFMAIDKPSEYASSVKGLSGKAPESEHL